MPTDKNFLPGKFRRSINPLSCRKFSNGKPIDNRSTAKFPACQSYLRIAVIGAFELGKPESEGAGGKAIILALQCSTEEEINTCFANHAMDK